jgi:hypothetical protein
VLAAVFVGASIPVLFQTFLTLRSARRFFDVTTRRVDRFMRQTTETLGSVHRTVAGVDGTVRMASTLVAALGPAVTAAVRAWRSPVDSGGVSYSHGSDSLDSESELHSDKHGAT